MAASGWDISSKTKIGFSGAGCGDIEFSGIWGKRHWCSVVQDGEEFVCQ